MKKVIVLLCTLVLCACSKESDNNVMEKQSKDLEYIELNFAPTYSIAPIGTRTTYSDLVDVATRLDIVVKVQDTNEQVAYITQQSTDADFGHVRLGLNKDTYSVLAVAYNTTTGAVWDGSTIAFGGKVTDTFFYTNNIPVGNKATEECNLQRRVAKLRLHLTDTAYPNLIKKIKVTFSKTGTVMNTSGWSNAAVDREEVMNVSDHADKIFEIYAFLPQQANFNTDFTIQALDEDNNVIEERTLTKVPLSVGCITTCEGSLFSETYTNFIFKAITDWTTGETKTF